MPSHRRWARSNRWALAAIFAGGLVAFGACQTPTSITFAYRTDVDCTTISPRPQAAVVVGAPAEVSKPRALEEPASTRDCEVSVSGGELGEVGTLVALPREDESAEVSMLAVMGVTRPTSDCGLEPDDEGDVWGGCIVARRRLVFIEGEALQVDVPFYLDCVGVPCDELSTCVPEKGCVSSKLDPSECIGKACSIGSSGTSSSTGATSVASTADVSSVSSGGGDGGAPSSTGGGSSQTAGGDGGASQSGSSSTGDGGAATTGPSSSSMSSSTTTTSSNGSGGGDPSTTSTTTTTTSSNGSGGGDPSTTSTTTTTSSNGSGGAGGGGLNPSGSTSNGVGGGGGVGSGIDCRTDIDCATGVCAQGVCCDVACGGCDSCLGAYTGGVDGTCAPVLVGDPNGACSDGACSSCDGAGQCDTLLCACFTDTDCDQCTPEGLIQRGACAGVSCGALGSAQACQGNYRCIDDACVASCSNNFGCRDGFHCETGACVVN